MPIKEKTPNEPEYMLKSIKANNPGIGDETISAFRIIDRKIFVKDYPYKDEAIHVAHNQTISQPTTIARMIIMLQLEQGQDILEIGTNTGYHAALVAWLIRPGKVISIEIFPDLAEQAKQNITKLNEYLKEIKKEQLNINIQTGDALDKKNKIWQKPEHYDRIYYTAGIEQNQRETVQQLAIKTLKNKGLLLFPTREHFDYGSLELWEKRGNDIKLIKKDQGYVFVPLIKQSDIEDIYKKLKK